MLRTWWTAGTKLARKPLARIQTDNRGTSKEDLTARTEQSALYFRAFAGSRSTRPRMPVEKRREIHTRSTIQQQLQCKLLKKNDLKK
jgi:hypothetical protein